MGSGWDSGVLVGQTAGTQLVHDQSESGQYNYFIRAFDTSGKYSTHVTTFQLILLAPSSVRQFDVVQSANRLEFRWLPNPEPEVVAYELREGGAWDTSIFIAEVKSSSYTLPSGFDGERKFWIKAIASPGIYSDEATFVSTVVAQPQNANLLVTMDAQATRFPGIKHFASVESVNSLDVLRMDSGVSQSEYLFEVNGNVSTVTDSAIGADATSTKPLFDSQGNAIKVSCEQLSNDATQTTLMLVELQRWNQKQSSANP